MSYKMIRAFVLPAILLVLLFISILVLANSLIHRQSVQAYLIKRISNVIGIEMHTREIDLNLMGGVGVMIHGFEAKSRIRNEHVSAERVRIILDSGDLIRGRITPTRLHLIEPDIELFLKDDFALPKGQTDSRIKGMPILWISRFQSILIDNGHVAFNGRDFHFDALFLDARQISPESPALNLRARGNIGYHGRSLPFETHGIVLPSFEGGVSTTLDMTFEAGKVPMRWIPWPDSMPFKQGDFQVQCKIEGNPRERTSVRGKVVLEPFRFSLLHHNREKTLIVPGLTLEFQSRIGGKEFTFPSIHMKNKDFHFEMDFALDLREDTSPYLALNVQSENIPVDIFKTIFPSPLLPSWIEDRLFPMLHAGDIRLKNLKVKGTVDQLRHLKKEENRSALELDFECHDLEVSGGGIQLPFKDVSALVSLKEGNFKISGTKGVFGESEIQNAELDIHDVFNEYPSYEVLFKGSFDIQELLRQREILFVPTDIREQLDSLQELAGRMECETRFAYMRDWEYPKILSGQWLFTDCTFVKKEVLLPLRVKEAEIRFEKNDRNRFTGTGLWGNSSFRTEGDFHIEKNKIELEKVNISAGVEIEQAVRALFDLDISPVTVKKAVNSNISLTRRSSDWVLHGDMDLNNVILESDDVIIGPHAENDRVFFDLEIGPGDIVQLKKILLNIKNSSIELSGSYDLKKRHFSEMAFRTPGLSMEDLGIYFKKKKIQAGGHLKGGLRLISSSPKLADADVEGRVEGKDLCFHSGGFSSPISECLFDLDISGKNLIINQWKMHVGESVLMINGKLKGWESLKGELFVRSEFLDMSDLYTPQNGSTKRDEKAEGIMNLINKAEITIRLDVKNGFWRKLTYGPLEAELDLKNSHIYIKDSKVDLANGSMTLNGGFRKDHTPQIKLSGHIHLTNQSIDELAEGIGIVNRELKGRLTMDAIFMMEGEEKKDMIPSLTGTANILIEEGLIKRSPVIIKVLDFLSLQNIFKKRPPDLRGEGFYFETMGGEMTIKKGVLRSENFVIKSPVFNAVAYGELDIPNKEIDFILGAQPHGTIDSLVSKIPLLGYIIEGEKGAILAYPFRVKGSVSKPEVTFVPFKKLGEGVLGVFKRLFLTPKRLIDELDKESRSIFKKDFPQNEE